ncbi:MAG: hypothetical protein KDC83_15310, partial [Flavobacteriales bacterium]|nr:hypothetical protein [Flavobacteriales bacterium]
MNDSSSFIDSSTTRNGGFVNWKWKFGNTDSSALQHPNHLFSSSDTFQIYLGVTDAKGCEDDTVKEILIYPLPIPNFSWDTVCFRNNTSFIDSSQVDSNWLNGLTSYLWRFDFPSIVGDSSHTQNPQYKFGSHGNHLVTLRITDSKGCSDSLIDTTYVRKLPLVDFTSNEICLGDSSLFVSNTSSNNGTILVKQWSVNGIIADTADTLIHVFTSCGLKTITLKVIDSKGCDTLITKQVKVHCLPKAEFTFNEVCLNDSTQFQDISTIGDTTISNWNWSFGESSALSNSQNPFHTYADSGKYGVSLSIIDHFGCRSDTIDSVKVNPLPSFSLGPDTNFCFGNSVLISGPNRMTSYLWNDNSTAQSQLISSSRILELKVVDTNGCIAKDTIEVVVNPLPSPQIGKDTILCAGTIISIGPNISFSKYKWSNNDTTRYITVTNQGIYSLTVTDTNDCKSDTNVSITYRTDLAVQLAPFSPKCVDDTAFTLSGGSPINGVYYINGLLAASYSPSNQGVGTDTILYVLTDTNGCSDSAQTSIITNALPSVLASNDTSICKGDSTLLISTGASSYIWTWPTNNISNSSILKVSPNSTTKYNLVGTDVNGCKNKDSVIVSIRVSPIPNAGPVNSICLGDSVKIGASGAGAGGSYLWNTTASSDSITVTPTLSSTYIVTVTDVNGCKGLDSVDITVNPLPNLSITGTTIICTGSSTTLTASAAGSSFIWDNSSTNPVRVVSPTTNTKYFVTATDGNSCSKNDSITVTVNPLPTVSLTPFNSVCINAPSFALSGGSPAGGSYSGNGVASNQFSPATAGVGAHTITYFFTDVNSCSDTAQKTITVTPKPTVTFSNPPASCVNAPSFNLNGGVPAGGVYSGVGVTGSSFNPASAGVGTHTLKYVFSDANACSDSANASAVVNPLPLLSISGNTTICTGQSTTLTATATGSSFIWDNSSTNPVRVVSPTN